MFRALSKYHGVNLKLMALVTVLPAVVISTLAVIAPVGTAAVTCLSASTVKRVAFLPQKWTVAVCVRLTPVILTMVPTGPLADVKLRICGVTRKIWLLCSVPP